ncbi:MAG: hypothetical protein ACYC9Q_09145 [Bacillota bacterium]
MDLTTVMTGLEVRGKGGKAGYPGNWSPAFIRPLIHHFHDASGKGDGFIVADAMVGSGTTKDVCDQDGITCDAYDLRPDVRDGFGGWNALKDDLARSVDLLMVHLPYWDLYRYSLVWGHEPHPEDLSLAPTWEGFTQMAGRVLFRLFASVKMGGHLLVLMGSIRRKGSLYEMAMDIPKPAPVAHHIIEVQENVRSANREYARSLIRIAHEDCLIFRRDDPYRFTFKLVKEATWDLREKPLTWRQAIYAALAHLGGRAHLARLYQELQGFAITRASADYAATVRARLQLNSQDFEPLGNGIWALRELSAAAARTA